MEHLDSFILDLALILAASSIVTVIFKKIKQPVVLGYIVAGFLISPNFDWLPTVISSDNISLWADIGIVFLMFGIGLEFNLHKVAEVGGGAVITAVVVISAMVTLGYTAGQLMGWSTMDSVFLGCMISMSSTMIVIKAYEEMGMKRRRFATLVVGALVIEDMAGIFMMIILTTISVTRNFSGRDLALELTQLLLILIVVLIIGIYIIPTLLKRIIKLLSDEMLLVFSLATCLVMVVISVSIGFSEALGAFLAGSILAGTVQAERIEHLVQPIKDLFGAVFFVSVGMLIVPRMLAEYWVQILILSLVVIVGQMLFSCIGCLISGQALKTAVRVGCSMCQVGEFSFILATLGSSLGVISDFLYPIIVCVSVITAFTTPIFIRNGEKVYFTVSRILPKSLNSKLSSYTSQDKGASNLDSDWKKYLKGRVIKMLVGIAGMLTVTMLFTTIIEEYVYNSLELGGDAARVALAVLAIACMLPFAYVMCHRKGRAFMKLWYKSNFNKLPLIAIWAVSLFIAAVFITIVLRRYIFTIPILVDVLIAIALVVVFLRVPLLGNRISRMETRFFVNFNERIIAHEKAERKSRSDKIWIDEKMRLVEYRLLDNSERKFVKDMISNKAFGCMIVSIFRSQQEVINLPKANTPLHNGDILTVIGSEEGMAAYSKSMQKMHMLEETKNGSRSLKEYLYYQMFDDDIVFENQLMCCALKPLTRADFMCGKSVKDSRFIAKYDGYMIAIERQGLQIISPDRGEILQEGDIIWCLGTQEMVAKLQEDDVFMM